MKVSMVSVSLTPGPPQTGQRVFFHSRAYSSHAVNDVDLEVVPLRRGFRS